MTSHTMVKFFGHYNSMTGFVAGRGDLPGGSFGLTPFCELPSLKELSVVALNG